MAPIASLSRVAEENGRIIASLQCWPVELRTPDQATPLVMLGPVAVLPELQRSGVGKALMQETRTAADDQGVKAIMLIGDAEIGTASCREIVRQYVLTSVVAVS